MGVETGLGFSFVISGMSLNEENLRENVHGRAMSRVD